MSEAKTAQKQDATPENEDPAKEQKGKSYTPDQKHQAYLETIEKLHSEP